MKYFIIAGEASGDLHGANLAGALRREDAGAEIHCWGGNLMEAAGATLLRHYRELAYMGFLEVALHLHAIMRNFRRCKSDILSFQPDVLILIDYPGFNLRMATWAKARGIRVFYYISPQLWAWKSGRVKIIREAVERMYVIFPFEKGFYRERGVEVEFLGHPLLDALNHAPPSSDFFQKNKLPTEWPVIALLPGSRRQEIGQMLKGMLQVAPHFPDYQFVIAGAPGIEPAFYRRFLSQEPNLYLVERQTYQLLGHASAALVTSGTATLETALIGIPQVVCYRGNPLSYWLAKRLVSRDLKFIAIVNLIAGKKVVEELIQQDFNEARLRQELSCILSPEGRRQAQEVEALVRERLGQAGASERVAKSMVKRLRKFSAD